MQFLAQYKIDGDDYTRVALVTYDETATVVFYLNTNTDWNSVYYALGNRWQYGPAALHTSTKNLTAALDLVNREVTKPENGFRRSKHNRLIIHTTGKYVICMRV